MPDILQRICQTLNSVVFEHITYFLDFLGNFFPARMPQFWQGRRRFFPAKGPGFLNDSLRIPGRSCRGRQAMHGKGRPRKGAEDAGEGAGALAAGGRRERCVPRGGGRRGSRGAGRAAGDRTRARRRRNCPRKGPGAPHMSLVASLTLRNTTGGCGPEMSALGGERGSGASLGGAHPFLARGHRWEAGQRMLPREGWQGAAWPRWRDAAKNAGEGTESRHLAHVARAKPVKAAKSPVSGRAPAGPHTLYYIKEGFVILLSWCSACAAFVMPKLSVKNSLASAVATKEATDEDSS